MSKTTTLNIQSKLPKVGTTIFTVMSALAAQHNAINLSQGFPNFDCSDRLKALVNKYMQQGFNQYAPMSGVPELRNQIAKKIESLYQVSINADTEITITNGATQALFTAVAAFIRPGDEVILIEPAYDSYGPSVEVVGGVVIPYELTPPDYAINWQKLSSLISSRTRMIMINSPHNPTGTTLKAHDLEELQRITADTNILVVSDEVYEHLIFDNKRHESVLRYPQLYQRSLAAYSFGKVFHNTGWRIGYCVAPPDLTREFRKVHQFNCFTINRPFQHGIADFLNDPQEYLGLSNFFGAKRDLFLKILQQTRFRPFKCEGTYFQMVDYSGISDEPDVDFAKRLTIEYGVAAIPVSVFYTSGRDEKVIRFCFGKTEDMLEKAGALLQKI